MNRFKIKRMPSGLLKGFLLIAFAAVVLLLSFLSRIHREYGIPISFRGECTEYLSSETFARELEQTGTELLTTLALVRDAGYNAFTFEDSQIERRMSKAREERSEEALRWLNSYYGEGNTNLTYFYQDLDGASRYTNCSAFEEDLISYEEMVAVLREKGRWLILSDTVSGSETSFSFWNEEHYMTDWIYRVRQIMGDEHFLFMLSVDEKLPIRDNLSVTARGYDRYAGSVQPACILAALSSVLFLVLFAVLSLTEGKGEERELLWDRAAPEGIALAEILIVLLYAGILRFVLQSPWWFTEGLILLSGLLVLLFWFSILRRIRKHCLRPGRITLALIRTTEGTLEQIPEALKTLIGFVLLMVSHSLLLQMDAGGRIPALFLLDTGVLIILVKRAIALQRLEKGLRRYAEGDYEARIEVKGKWGILKTMTGYVNALGEGMHRAVEQSIREERLRTELITNVSHDLKTPLTSIISYIDLLKKNHSDPVKMEQYLDILERKAMRLKALTDDVVEASKASTGNLQMEYTELDYTELMEQVLGEESERFTASELVTKLPQERILIKADGRRLWRVLDNLFSNAVKYSQPGTRVYGELRAEEDEAVFTLKNISAQPLNISAEELTERFVRGDTARSTEGSGLGLSIARSFTELMGGKLILTIDGDLFKAEVRIPRIGSRDEERQA